MEVMIDLFTRGTTITCIPFFHRSFETVEGFCELESHPLLSDPFIAQEEVTVTHFILMDCPFKEFNGLFVTQNVFE
jgi:hypothetical protein